MTSNLRDSSVSTVSGEAHNSAASNRRDYAAWVSRVRVLLRIDGVFEAVLGVVLLLSPVTGLYSTLALPSPASKLIVVVAGLLLLPLLPFLWLISREPRRQLVLLLAVANGAGAFIFAIWTLLWNGAFNRSGATFVSFVAGILGLLAALQAREILSARSRRSPVAR